MALRIVLAILAGYIFGNLNGAIITSNFVLHGDVREHGSGNAGLTNFLRSYGGVSTFLVLAIDIGKTVLACLVGMCLFSEFGLGTEGKMLCGMACIIGHMFPVVYGFKGGKGILSAGTLAVVMDWRVGLIIIGIFAVVVVCTRYVSLGSLIAAAAYPFVYLAFFWGSWAVVLMSLAIAILAAYMHRANIERLVHHTESKFSIHKNKS
jgi:acyl phosphate:glycerol-3-phosphate acyltransferase